MANPPDESDQVSPGTSVATTNDAFWPWSPTAEVPYATSHNNDRFFVQAPSTNLSFSSQPVSPGTPGLAPPGGGRGSNPNVAWNKVAIPRAPNATTISHRRRSQRACEPCRQRKIKCDGNRPSCRQCIEHNQQCSYEDVKRVRDQKRLGSLSRRVDRYESLLRELEVDADATTARKIRKVLKVGLDDLIPLFSSAEVEPLFPFFLPTKGILTPFALIEAGPRRRLVKSEEGGGRRLLIDGIAGRDRYG